MYKEHALYIKHCVDVLSLLETQIKVVVSGAFNKNVLFFNLHTLPAICFSSLCWCLSYNTTSETWPVLLWKMGLILFKQETSTQ